MIAIHSASDCSKRRYCFWRRTVVDEPNPPSTIAGGYDATPNAGKSNGSSPGFTTSEGSSFAGNIMPKTISPSSNSDVQLFSSGIYEMACSHYHRRIARRVIVLSPFLRHLNAGTLAFVLFVALTLLSTM